MPGRVAFAIQRGARFLRPGAEYALVLGEQRPGADLGVAAVIRALGSDLGGYTRLFFSNLFI